MSKPKINKICQDCIKACKYETQYGTLVYCPDKETKKTKNKKDKQ